MLLSLSLAQMPKRSMDQVVLDDADASEDVDADLDADDTMEAMLQLLS